MKFISERKQVDGIDLDLLDTQVNSLQVPTPRATGTPKVPKPTETQESERTDELKSADEQMQRDLRMLQDRLKKAKHLTLNLRTELLDIESVITRLQKLFPGDN